MGEERKSAVQKLFAGMVSPSTAASMEADSRRWMMQCPRCGYERSIWDMGGIRYKAVGNQRNLMRCLNCGKISWHKTYRREGPLPEVPAHLPSTVSATASTTRRFPRWTLWTMLLGIGALAALVIFCLLGILLLTTTLTQPIVSVGDDFMAALKTRNDAQAYALCAPDLQNELGGVIGISDLLQGYRPAQWNWTTRSIRNGVGRLEGSFTSTGGTGGTIQLMLRQFGNDWRIVSIRLNQT